MQKIEFFSDKVHPINGNFTIETTKTVNKFKVYLFVNFPENENDREFRKALFKTVIDSDKFFSGVYANPVVRYLVELILKSAKFEPKLPFKPVSLCFHCEKVFAWIFCRVSTSSSTLQLESRRFRWTSWTRQQSSTCVSSESLKAERTEFSLVICGSGAVR